jgi:hypothetical protein
VDPFAGPLVMRLVAAVPTGVEYPFALVGGDLRHLPYATGAADLTMFWDVSTRSNRPHCVIVGPTGGGKGFVIRTIADRGGAPWHPVRRCRSEDDRTRRHSRVTPVVARSCRTRSARQCSCVRCTPR